jgi:hypothetical protein
MKITNRTRTCSFVVGICLAALASPALAEDSKEIDDVAPVSDAPDGQESVLRGVQGPAGMFSARVLLDVNLSKDLAGEPLSVMPNLYYSFTDKLQLGIVHDTPMGWQTKPGPGLCLSGEDSGCPQIYDNVGFDVMYGLGFGDLHLSAHGTLYVTSIDNSDAMATVGAAGKAHFSDKVALYFDPQIGIALSDRDVNDDYLFLPLELQYQLSAPTQLKLLSGVNGSLSEFGDTHRIPMGVGLVQNLTPNFDLGARFSFDNLLGETNGAGRADERSLAVLANFRR